MPAAWKGPETYLDEQAGTVAVPYAVAAILMARAGLSAYHVRNRGIRPEVDAVLAALKIGALRYRSELPQGQAECAEVGIKFKGAVRTSGLVGVARLETVAAAEQLGITPRAVRLACEEGRLSGELTDGRWLISRDAVDRYVTRKARNGNKRSS